VRSPRAGADLSRFRRGELTHKLLQILPNMPEAARAEAAAAFLAQPGHGLAPGLAVEIARETLAILQHPDFSPLFGPGSLAEVPLTGLVGGRLVSGQIDRLLIAPDTVSIVDFKTNRPPPREAHAVPALYQSQLAAYRATLAAIYPGRAIRSFLLWTDGPILMEIT
jgi:ATP-dependent helicase/nuclease subunit A